MAGANNIAFITFVGFSLIGYPFVFCVNSMILRIFNNHSNFSVVLFYKSTSKILFFIIVALVIAFFCKEYVDDILFISIGYGVLSVFVISFLIFAVIIAPLTKEKASKIKLLLFSSIFVDSIPISIVSFFAVFFVMNRILENADMQGVGAEGIGPVMFFIMIIPTIALAGSGIGGAIANSTFLKRLLQDNLI